MEHGRGVEEVKARFYSRRRRLQEFLGDLLCLCILTTERFRVPMELHVPMDHDDFKELGMLIANMGVEIAKWSS